MCDHFARREGAFDGQGIVETNALPHFSELSEQAAALMQSLAMNHAFVDGKKRVAVPCTVVFLRMNGYRLSVGADEAERFLIEEVIGGAATVERITEWLESHMLVARSS